MPIYMRFLLNGLPTGGTTAARHHGMQEILGISWGGPTMAPSVNEIVIAKLTDVSSTNLYPLFDPRFVGGITVAASAGADRPGDIDKVFADNQRTAGKPTERNYYIRPQYDLARAKPLRRNDPATLTAEIDFTRTHGGGAETTDLRALAHDVRIVRYERAVPSGSATPVERIVLRYSRMTHAGLPKSSPDISHQVRVRLG